jgi:hypothetical protein
MLMILQQELAITTPVASGTRLLSQLNALKRIAKYAPAAFATQESELFQFLLGLLSSKHQKLKRDPDDVS